MPFQYKNIENDPDGAVEREAEYNQLKMALHLAQIDRAHYVEEMNSAMLKMKHTIENLEQEGADLLEKLQALDSPSNQLRDQRICEDLVNLAENKDWLQRQIENEKSKQAVLDSKLRSLEKKVADMKLEACGMNATHYASDHGKGKTITLENRLVHVLKKYNDVIGTNKRLRDDIDTYRLQRSKFDQLYTRLDQTLARQRAAIKRLMEATSAAYDQREDAALRVQQLTEKADKDIQQHTNEMKELVRLIDHDRKLRHFMRIKATERQEDPQLTAWKAKRMQEADDQRAEVNHQIERYEQAFDRMLEIMDENSTENLVRSFLEKEDRNFALFNYVSETNGEIERLNEINQNLTREMSKYRDWMSEALGGQREALADWKKLNNKSKDQQESMEHRLEAVRDMLASVCVSVGEMVKNLKCDTTMLTRRLASAEGVTQANLLDHLRLVEAQVNRLLLIRQFIAVNDPDAPYAAKSILVGNNLTKPVEQPPAIHAPNLQDDFSDDASDLALLKPLSREELHRRVVSLVRRKEQEVKSSLSGSLTREK